MIALLLTLAIISGLLMLLTAACGLWLRYSGKPIEANDLTFHMGIAFLTVLVSAVTIVVSVVNVLNRPV